MQELRAGKNLQKKTAEMIVRSSLILFRAPSPKGSRQIEDLTEKFSLSVILSNRNPPTVCDGPPSFRQGWLSGDLICTLNLLYLKIC